MPWFQGRLTYKYLGMHVAWPSDASLSDFSDSSVSDFSDAGWAEAEGQQPQAGQCANMCSAVQNTAVYNFKTWYIGNNLYQHCPLGQVYFLVQKTSCIHPRENTARYSP